MCPFHWELDCVGFSPFEIWRCGCVEMMREIGGEGFLFPFLGIAGVSPEYRRKYVSCLALCCLVAAAAATAATAAGSAGPAAAAAVAAAYLPATELRAPQGAHAAVVTGWAIGGQPSPGRA